MKFPVNVLNITVIAVLGLTGISATPANAQFTNPSPIDNPTSGGSDSINLPPCLEGKNTDSGVSIAQVVEHCGQDSSSDNQRFLKKIRPVFLQQANQMADMGKLAAAESSFQQLASLYPEDPLIQYKLGEVRYRQGKSESAITAYQTAIEKNANYAIAYNGLGQAFASQQRLDEAKIAYEKALTINPNYADALMNLGYVLWKQGKSSEATTKLETAKTIFQQQRRSVEVKQIEKLLEEIRKAPPGIV